jgi:predicted negative regulator of RcsB-dependent stress response
MARRDKLKDVPPDAFQSALQGFFNRLGSFSTLLLCGMVLVIGTVVGVQVFRARSAARADAAAARFEKVLEELSAITPEATGRPEALARLELFAREDVASPLRPLALFLLGAEGMERAERAKAPEARAQLLARADEPLREFGEKYPEHPLATLAAERRGVILEEQGEYERALAVYQGALARAKDSVLAPKLHYDKARCLAAQRKGEDALHELELAGAAGEAAQEYSWRDTAKYLEDILRWERQRATPPGTPPPAPPTGAAPIPGTKTAPAAPATKAAPAAPATKTAPAPATKAAPTPPASRAPAPPAAPAKPPG